MKTNDILFGMLLGSMLTVLFTMIVLSLPGTYRHTMVTALEECEYRLPRNQNCIITAIPETTQTTGE